MKKIIYLKTLSVFLSSLLMISSVFIKYCPLKADAVENSNVPYGISAVDGYGDTLEISREYSDNGGALKLNAHGTTDSHITGFIISGERGEFSGEGIGFWLKGPEVDTWGCVAVRSVDNSGNIKWFKTCGQFDNPAYIMEQKNSQGFFESIDYDTLYLTTDWQTGKPIGNELKPTDADIANIDMVVIGIYMWSAWSGMEKSVYLDTVSVKGSREALDYQDVSIANFENGTASLVTEVSLGSPDIDSYITVNDGSCNSNAIKIKAKATGETRLAPIYLSVEKGSLYGDAISFTMKGEYENTWGMVALRATYADGSHKWFKLSGDYGNPAKILSLSGGEFTVTINYQSLSLTADWLTEPNGNGIKPQQTDILNFDMIGIGYYIWKEWSVDSFCYIDDFVLHNKPLPRYLEDFEDKETVPQSVVASSPELDTVSISDKVISSGKCLELKSMGTAYAHNSGVRINVQKGELGGRGLSFCLQGTAQWGAITVRTSAPDGNFKWFRTGSAYDNPANAILKDDNKPHTYSVIYKRDLKQVANWQTDVLMGVAMTDEDIANINAVYISIYMWTGSSWASKTTYIDTLSVIEPIPQSYKNDILLYDFGETLYGDANGDNSVDIRDLVCIKKFLLNIGVHINAIAANLDYEKGVTLSDAVALRKLLLGDTSGHFGVENSYGTQQASSVNKWQNYISSRKTVSNINNYSFDERKYSETAISGGSIERNEEFVRGIIYDGWHGTEGYGWSQATKLADEANMKELAIMSYRDYTGGLNTQGGYDYYNSLGRTLTDTYGLNTGQSVMTNGVAGGHLWINNNVLQNCIKKITDNLKQIQDTSAMEVMLFGNEEQWKGQDPVDWKHYDSGYDSETLDAFRNQWLKKRYGSIGNLNKIIGSSYSSFNSIDPRNNNKMAVEFWLFKRDVFENFYKSIYNAAKQVNSSAKFGLAKFIGRTPDSDDAYLKFMDYGCQNLYVWYDMFWYTSRMNQLCSVAAGKPCYNTESGFIMTDGAGNLTEASLNSIARKYKQVLPLTYMEPQMQGFYAYKYTGEEYLNINFSYGLTSPIREKRPAYYSVKQCYNDFKYMDTFMIGVSYSPLVGITHRLIDELSGEGANDMDTILHTLQSVGVGTTVVTGEYASAYDEFGLDKIILNDIALNQNPDGTNDVGTAIANFLKDPDNRIITFNKKVPYSYFGKVNAFTADSMNALTKKYPNFTYSNTSKSDYDGMWNVLSEFVHGDFVNGKVKAEKNAINESAIRILDTATTTDAAERWNVQTRLLYKDGHVYLGIVNCGTEPIDQISITLGVNKGVKFNLHPDMIRCDGEVTVSKPSRALLPEWTESSEISYGTVVLDGLDTYAFVDLGMAIVE